MNQTVENNTPPSVSLRNVSKHFASQTVLRDISIDIRPNETLVLIGESGCGKSVTMKLMMSLLQPSQGEVHWAGRPVTTLTDTELNHQRLRFGYLFQGAALFDSLTVFENVAFGLRQNTRMSEQNIREVVYERLREVGLTEAVCNRKPAQLSGGMKKRVGLARALALSPDVMFYDEPTTGLDPIMSDVINELIQQTRARQPVTSVVVTHDMRTVEKVADRIIMFYPHSRLAADESQIVFEGSYAEALDSTDPRVASFIRGQAGDRIKELALTA